VQVNIEIMRAFVGLRRMVASNAELARRLHELEKYDGQFKAVFDMIRELMIAPRLQRRPISLRVEEARPGYEAPRWLRTKSNRRPKAGGRRRVLDGVLGIPEGSSCRGVFWERGKTWVA